MQKTQKTNTNNILVDTETLKGMLGCGRPTAVSIGSAANARIRINRRVLWNLALVQKYLEEVAE
jgi:hypothetical protein